MKAKKWLTIITSCFSILSIAAAFLIGKDANCIFFDISMAVFGSALLGAIMSLTEYFVERRKAMETFWDEARKVLCKLRKIRYINVDAPHDLICACFREEEANEWCEALKVEKAEVAKSNLIAWFQENVVMSFNEDEDVDEKLQWLYTDRMEHFRREYQCAIDSYSIAAEINVGFLGNAYGNLDFFFNKCIRNKAYNDVYQKMVEFRNRLLSESYHFSLLNKGNGRLSVCADKAYQICQIAFTTKDEVVGGFSNKVVYQELFDDIDNSLEQFRCKIDRSENCKPIKRIPILGTIKVISFEENND